MKTFYYIPSLAPWSKKSLEAEDFSDAVDILTTQGILFSELCSAAEALNAVKRRINNDHKKNAYKTGGTGTNIR